MMANPVIESDLGALVRACLADLSLCGILADWLEERGDARGVLLRRRWKRWEAQQERIVTYPFTLGGREPLQRMWRADDDFVAYIHDRFRDAA